MCTMQHSVNLAESERFAPSVLSRSWMLALQMLELIAKRGGVPQTALSKAHGEPYIAADLANAISVLKWDDIISIADPNLLDTC